MLFALLALHGVCGLAALAGARRLGRRGLLVGAVPPAAVVVWLAVAASGVLDGDPVTGSAQWVPALGLDFDLRADAFTLLMAVLVSGIGVLVFAYGWHYFAESGVAGRVAGLLTLFAGSMLGLILADNLLILYVFWELTSITSYLLIGVDDTRPDARAAALHALLVTALGGLVMLGGFVILGQQAGTFRLSALVASPPSGTLTAVALVLVLVGAFTKSAQYPFHSWLPGAMVAPTPVSAYLHSAAMVQAGVYLIARLAPAFADVGVWRPLVVSVGLVTMIAGGLRALLPADLKQLLALGTISQLGFLTVLFGIGQPAATTAGCALILAHGFFKAALFMVVGIVDHETHTRVIDLLPTLGPGWGPTRTVAFVSAASMAAIPPLAGFVAKEEAFGALVDGSTGNRLVLAGIVAGSVLTVVYSLRFACALWRPSLVSEIATDRAEAAHSPPLAFVVPAAVLATGTVLFGIVPAPWSALVDHAAHALDPQAHAHLQLWHGITPALGLSLCTLAAGLVVFLARRSVVIVQSRLAPPITGLAVYDATVRGMLRLAGRVTSVAQSGSLPIYATVILTTAVLAPAAAMATGTWWTGWPNAVGRATHVPIAGLLIAGGVAATVTRQRFAAALLLGVVGYGMALLFVVQGAPDLALTQFAVETLSVLVFLLVLRQLPDRFERPPRTLARVIRLAVSTLVGVFVVVMALSTSGARTEPPVSREMSAQALPEGDGKNVVNVILVDIRGMDTMGEITVLVAAAIGITALARAGQTPRQRQRPRTRRRRDEHDRLRTSSTKASRP